MVTVTSPTYLEKLLFGNAMLVFPIIEEHVRPMWSGLDYARPPRPISRRSHGQAAHPKRKRNMVTHSRRVRRRHRRAA